MKYKNITCFNLVASWVLFFLLFLDAVLDDVVVVMFLLGWRRWGAYCQSRVETSFAKTKIYWLNLGDLIFLTRNFG